MQIRYYHAKDDLFPNEEDIVDYNRLVKNCIKEITNFSQIQDNDLDKIKSKCSGSPELLDLIEFEYRKNLIISKNKLKIKKIISKFFNGYSKFSYLLISDIIEVNLKSLDILNIYDATEFLKYCHFPEDIERTSSRDSDFLIKKLCDNVAIYRKFNLKRKQYLNHSHGSRSAI